MSYWKGANEIIEGNHTVYFDGDPGAVSQSVPVLWRFSQDWWTIEVKDTGRQTHQHGYYLFRHIGGISMKYQKSLHTRYVMVRVGPLPATYWARCKIDNSLLMLKRTTVMKPACRFKSDRNVGVTLQEQLTWGGHSWV